jgi:hypothetical protein
MWNPVPFTDIVLELLAGTRVSKNGERASSSQIQASPCAAQTPRCALTGHDKAMKVSFIHVLDHGPDSERPSRVPPPAQGTCGS